MTKKSKFKMNLTTTIIVAILILGLMADTYLPLADWLFSGEISETSSEYTYATRALSQWQTAYFVIIVSLTFVIKKIRTCMIYFFKPANQPGLQGLLIIKALIATILIVGLTYMAAFMTIKWMGTKEALYFIPNLFYVIIPLIIFALIVSYRIRKRKRV